ncbi:Hypothetical protein R9X50_00148900 [Acrodontium crateriforme]|uniref:Uncharacterized protein n=1 Tax=Acrodontium crateriforme TaxID=150365 RepID=A0AAQ3R7X9_9PEZI|nr:Hypothetical protein R9X50_00148900 [Acrodontium crateriforme]
MQLLYLFTFAPLAVASTLGRRDANAVYDDITGIDTAVRALTAAVNAYNGGILQSQPVFDRTLAVHNSNRQGFADATASSSFSEADSKRIVDHVSNSVGISIPESAKAIEAKKPLFDDAQLSSVIESTIQLLKSDHETFSAAVGTKLTLDQAPAGLAAAGAIDGVLQELALYYAL